MKNSLAVATPSDLEIVMTRTFNAPRRLVWNAMTMPEFIRRWIFAPHDWTMTACEGEAILGGAFRWAWNGPDGKSAMTISGVNREVLPPERIVHTERMELGEGVFLGEMISTLELAEHDGRTTLRMTMLFPSKESRDGALASGMERGVGAGYDTLDQLLAALT
jgi:uncharacterized protein YndB with AHSA1/START domain